MRERLRPGRGREPQFAAALRRGRGGEQQPRQPLRLELPAPLDARPRRGAADHHRDRDQPDRRRGLRDLPDRRAHRTLAAGGVARATELVGVSEGAARRGRARQGGRDRARPPAGTRSARDDLAQPIVCVPLAVQDRPIGAIAIYGLLAAEGRLHARSTTSCSRCSAATRRRRSSPRSSTRSRSAS